MKRLLFTLLTAVLLCVPAYAMTVEEAMDIILDYHGVETDVNVSNYLTISSGIMTREAAVTAVIRSYGVYPQSDDYVWADEAEQRAEYQPYIDYAYANGITYGVGDNRFDPQKLVTESQLRTMLERADGIEPTYSLEYDAPICKLLSVGIQEGLAKVPKHVVDSFYAEGRKITATTYPIVHHGEEYRGWIWYDGDVFIATNSDSRVYQPKSTTIHEIGHYVGYKMGLIRRFSVPSEREWMIEQYGDYCDTNDQEYFAESFVAYILEPENLAANAPKTYSCIQTDIERIVKF